MRRILFLFSALMLFSTQTLAGGFMIGEMATRASGMGSAFTAVSDDASAAWHNPAGVAFTEGSQAMLGGDVILLNNGSYASNTATKGPGGAPITNTANAKDKTFFVPHAYFTYWDKDSKLGGSLSINAPFGLETEWPDTAAFNKKNTFSKIQMIMVNPSIIYKVNDSFSVALGIDYGYVQKVNLNNTIQTLSGDGDGWGGNASIFYKSDVFNVGVTYRSRIKVDLNGSAIAVPTGALAGSFGGTTTGVKTSITLPDQVNVGLAYKPSDQLTLSLDVDWVNWKTFDSIDITYNSAAYRTAVMGLQGAIGAAVTGATSLPQNWKATVAFRAGLEWKLNAQMRGRLGYVFDPTPIKDADFSPSIPGNDRHIFSIGYGYDVKPDITIDLGYAYVYFKERNQTASLGTPPGSPNSVKNGVYKSDVHILMASLNYHF